MWGQGFEGCVGVREESPPLARLNCLLRLSSGGGGRCLGKMPRMLQVPWDKE